MKLNEAIKEVSVAVDMHDTDKANEGWKVIKSNLEILEILRKNITLRDLYDIARISKMMRFEITDNDKEVFERVKEWLEQWKD